MMRCPICSEEVKSEDQADRWGPEFAHATCVTAYNAGKADERERCASLCEAHAGMRGTGAWTALTAAADRIRDPDRAKRDAAPVEWRVRAHAKVLA
jgi:hypothetical protein